MDGYYGILYLVRRRRRNYKRNARCWENPIWARPHRVTATQLASLHMAPQSTKVSNILLITLFYLFTVRHLDPQLPAAYRKILNASASWLSGHQQARLCLVGLLSRIFHLESATFPFHNLMTSVTFSLVSFVFTTHAIFNLI